MVRCNVQGCERKEREDKNHRFFSQPKSPRRCMIWREFADIKDDQRRSRICSDHFDPAFYEKNKASVRGPKDMLKPLLHKNAVPTIKISPKSPKRLHKMSSNPSTRNLDPSSGNTMNIANKGNHMEIRRPAIQGGCSHQNRGIIVDVKKSADTEGATVHIETNSAVNVILTIEDEEDPPNLNSVCSLSTELHGAEQLSKSPITQSKSNSPLSNQHSATKPKTTVSSSADIAIFGTPTKRYVGHSSKALTCNTLANTRTYPIPHAVLLTPKSLRINTQKRTISILRSRVNRLKQTGNKIKKCKEQKKKKMIESLITQCQPYLTKEAQVIFETQLRLSLVSSSRRRFSNDLKNVALSIYYLSSKTYKFLNKFLSLPSKRTLREYQKKWPVSAGFNEIIISQLEKTFKNAPIPDRVVLVLFDEITIPSEIHYDNHRDEFIGVVDDGENREPMDAKTALVCMITWINKPMKQVIGYWFLGKNGSASVTHDIVEKSIKKIESISLIVKCVICDQGPKNYGLLTKFGLSAENPYFFIGDNQHKIFFIYDVPHLLKSMRTNRSRYTLFYKRSLVYWKELVRVFHLNQKTGLNLIPKLTESHIKLTHFPKMRVSLAAQLLSQSMYTALQVYHMMCPAEFGTFEESTTTQFLVDMDKLFDALNSSLERETVPNKLNYAISDKTRHIIVPFLKEMSIALKGAEFKGSKQVKCIDGFVLRVLFHEQ